MDRQLSRISSVEKSIQDLSRESGEKCIDFQLTKTAFNELTYSEPTKRNERNSINLVGLQLPKDPVPVEHSVSTTRYNRLWVFVHKANLGKNCRNVNEITRPSRQSVLEKEPRSIYQNNSPLCRNSIQQVNLTSPQPTSGTSYRTWPSHYSGNVVQNRKVPSTPPSYIGHRTRPGEYSGSLVQNQKLSISALPQKSNSNQSIPTRITSRKQRTNGRGKKICPK